MDKGGKIFTLILVVLVLLFGSLSFGAVYFFQKERQEKVGVQQQLEEARRLEAETRAKLEDSKKAVSSLDEKLEEAKKQIAILSESIEKEKGAKQEALNQVDQLLSQLEKQKKDKSDLEKMFTQTQQEMTGMQSTLQEIESKRLALEGKVKDLEEQARKVELGKIVVSPEASLSSAASAGQSGGGLTQEASGQDLQGKVLVINKDYNFIVTNLGKKDGVGVGDMFSVYHGDSYIGDVKIEKIHDSMSAAGFVSQDTRDKVNEGDKVVQKAK